MKKNLNIFMLFFAVLMFVGCNSRVVNSPELHRQWMLVEFKNFNKEKLVKSKAYLDLSTAKSPENRYGAFMGCNKMFLTGKFKSGGKVEFAGIGSTMMYCDKNMDLEGEFVKTLPTMKFYKIEGHNLILSDGKGNQMKFVAADWD